MRKLGRRLLKDDKGATMVEYALIVAVLSLTIMVGVGGVANNLLYLWGDTNSKLNSAWSKPD